MEPFIPAPVKSAELLTPVQDQQRRYDIIRHRMRIDAIAPSEVSERVQLALSLALSNARARGDAAMTATHTRFAVDALAWLMRWPTS